MNILFFLKPKATLTYLYDDFTIRQALEKMQKARFSTIPIITREGDYVGSLTEGDVLWAIKSQSNFDIKKAEELYISDLNRVRSYQAIEVGSSMEELIKYTLEQNFVPVVDDRNKFIGIVTRRDILKEFFNKEEFKKKFEETK